MESLSAPANFMDDLLDFGSDIGEEEDDTTKTLTLSFPLLLPIPALKTPGNMVEEELEWISNKDAFPMVESLVDMIPNKHHRSPVSVLENATNKSAVLSLCSGVKVPVRARSKKGKRRREVFDGQQWRCWGKENQKKSCRVVGRKCLHCEAEKTPQWRAGPMGPKTLCNACGVRFKSGRLLPEYRPASSPTFSSEVHSNSHRKIVEMRKHKQVT